MDEAVYNEMVKQPFTHLYEVQEITEKRVEVIMAGLLEKNPHWIRKWMLWLGQGI